MVSWIEHMVEYEASWPHFLKQNTMAAEACGRGRSIKTGKNKGSGIISKT